MSSNEKYVAAQSRDNQNEPKKNHKGARPNARWTSTFKGETQEMNRNVFQLQSEHVKKGQFDDSLEALQRYAGKFYPVTNK